MSNHRSVRHSQLRHDERKSRPAESEPRHRCVTLAGILRCPILSSPFDRQTAISRGLYVSKSNDLHSQSAHLLHTDPYDCLVR